ncbi:MAG: GPR endopeptidase [Clostridiales bacterium]|nr:GPR endopeptidase [Clostridiales bacterium]
MIDLIDECGEDLASCGYETIKLGKISCSKLVVDKFNAKKIGFNEGHYFVLKAPIDFVNLENFGAQLFAELSCRLKFLLKKNKITKKDKILFVGIGNPEIMADSFGAAVVNKIEILPFKKSNRFIKIIPNTFSNTGINAYDMIRLLVEAFDISAVFLFDALATTEISRLGTTIQFNDAGLTPGSAMNNFGLPINRETINVPCFAVGVPLMISAKQLVKESPKDLVLTEKDVKDKVEFLSGVVADALMEIL